MAAIKLLVGDPVIQLSPEAYNLVLGVFMSKQHHVSYLYIENHHL